MDVLAILEKLNWVDWAIVLIVLFGALGGIQRGLVLGVLDLVGLASALLTAVLGYRAVSAWLAAIFDVPSGIASIAAIVGVALLVQAVYWWLVGPVLHTSHSLIRSRGLVAAADRVLGACPGAAHGVIVASLLVLPIGLLPLPPSISVAIEHSTLASRVLGAVTASTAELEAQLGRDLGEGLIFLQPPHAEQGRELELGHVGTLSPDPEAEQRMLQLVNREREQVGLPPLMLDERLREVARRHSRDMFEFGYFSHVSPTTGSPAERIRAAGISAAVSGENLAYAPNVRIAHEGLMNSPGHRANILRAAFGRIGIGVIRSEFRGSMYTQNFRA